MAILIANLAIIMFNFGAGCFANIGGDANFTITFLSWISPMHYGVEIIFRRVTDGIPYQEWLLEQFGYTSGLTFCFCYLIGFMVAMMLMGWFILWYKNRHH